MGKVGSLSADFSVIQAAKILNCSAIELDEHPKKAVWMKRAFTYQRGISDGEKMLKENPEFISQQKKEQTRLKELYK